MNCQSSSYHESNSFKILHENFITITIKIVILYLCYIFVFVYIFLYLCIFGNLETEPVSLQVKLTGNKSR